MNLKTRQLIAGIAIGFTWLVLSLYFRERPIIIEGTMGIILIVLLNLITVIFFYVGASLITESLKEEEECECDDMSDDEFFQHMNEIENDESNNSRQ